MSLFNEGGKDLEAFVEMIKAGKILQKYEVSDTKVMDALQKVLTEGREYNRLEGHNGNVNSVSFSSDGKTLATSSDDDTIKLWNGEYGWGLDGFIRRSCDWVRVYLQNPNSDAREEDRGLCDGIGGK